MRTWLVLGVLLAAGAATRPALTAGGGGAHAVSGYRVADVRYELEGARVTEVSFTLDRPATTVRARLADDVPWSDCVSSGGRLTCKIAVSVAAVRSLLVAAAG